MPAERIIHPDFQFHLDFKNKELIELYTNLRAFVLDICPDANELLYHTHALTSLYTVSPKMSDGFCMIPIYTNHLNLGFNKGTLLNDPNKLLKGTGKLIRHIPVKTRSDFENKHIEDLIREAYQFALEDSEAKTLLEGKTISKIKA